MTSKLELNAQNWHAIKRDLSDWGLNRLTDSGFILVEEGPWISDFKYQSREMVFRDVGTNKFYRYYDCRSGSPFTDYDYVVIEFSELEQVLPHERNVIVWEKV